jgi:pilus assembly protein CpaF
MTLMAGVELPVRAIREQIASALDMVVHLERLRDGTRTITNVTEIQGMEGDTITMMDIFIFEQTGLEQGKVIGRLRPTGLRPKFLDRIESSGIRLPATIFGVADRKRY